MQKWKPISESRNYKRKQIRIKTFLIGIILLLILMLLGSCKQIEYVYVEVPREPVTCIDSIKIPLDMANCLAEYKVKYD